MLIFERIDKNQLVLQFFFGEISGPILSCCDVYAWSRSVIPLRVSGAFIFTFLKKKKKKKNFLTKLIMQKKKKKKNLQK